MHTPHRMLLLGLLLSPLCAIAQVHKCQGQDGRITYSGSPCVGAAKSSQVDIETGAAPAPQPAARHAYAAEQTARITEALKRDDFAAARRLATTDEQFRIINEVEQIDREERQAARDKRRANRPSVCTTMNIGAYRGANTSTTVCNK